MFKKKLDFIVDIETININAPCFNMDGWDRAIFNVGITAVERKSRQIIISKQIGIEKIWSVPNKFIMDFYRKNFTRADFEMMFLTFKEFTLYFNSIVEEYSKQYDICFWSYNAMFDSEGFKINAEREGVKLHPLTSNWYCIMMLSTHFLSIGAAAIQFANWSVETAYLNYRKNKSKILEYITPIGNIRTTAQNVYRFLTNNVEFIELHKGLQDTQCEMEILQWCQGHSGWTKVNANPGVGWRLVNFDFVMGRNGIESKGHLVNGYSLTQSNLVKLQELLNIINIEESESVEKSE